MSLESNLLDLTQALDELITFENSTRSKIAIKYVFNVSSEFQKLIAPRKHLKLSYPQYNNSEDYSNLCENLNKTIQASLAKLKNYSFENNWLQESIDYYDEVRTIEKASNPHDSIKIRRRRPPNELERDHKCPFLECNKEYSSKNA